jgi:hypothetical protein
MNDDRDLLLSFRADRDRWADRARAEARAVRLALAEGAAGSAAAAAASRRLVRTVEFIRATNARTIDAHPAMIIGHGVTPDEAEHFQDMVDEIVALNTEMYALLLVNTAALRAAMKPDDDRSADLDRSPTALARACPIGSVYRPWPISTGAQHTGRFIQPPMNEVQMKSRASIDWQAWATR